MNKRSKCLVASIVIILFLAPTFLVSGSNDFPKEKIISLVNAGVKNINSGNPEKALANLGEAKGLIASQMVALSPGESQAKVGKLTFSIEDADDEAYYNSVCDYYKFHVSVKLSNESNELLESQGWETVGDVKMSGYAISPEGNQIEDNFTITFDHLLPGVNKEIQFPFIVGMDSSEEFIPGSYTIMIRLQPKKGEAVFIKDKFTIEKDS